MCYSCIQDSPYHYPIFFQLFLLKKVVRLFWSKEGRQKLVTQGLQIATLTEVAGRQSQCPAKEAPLQNNLGGVI